MGHAMSGEWNESIVHRRHKNDRPPKWDGVTINWSGWMYESR